MAARGRSRNEHIDHRPIASLGNSDGDLKMLQWTMGGDGPRSGNHLYLEDECGPEVESHGTLGRRSGQRSKLPDDRSRKRSAHPDFLRAFPVIKIPPIKTNDDDD